jgi:hypothetical protein
MRQPTGENHEARVHVARPAERGSHCRGTDRRRGPVGDTQAHNINGAIAAAANAARQGVLVGTAGGSLTISSIGSQTVVSSSVVSTNSTINSPIDATQTSSNTGDVSNQGTINGR